jgi:hypothetical protein
MRTHKNSCKFLDFYELPYAKKVPEKVVLHGNWLSGRIFSKFPATLAGKVQNNLATVFFGRSLDKAQEKRIPGGSSW